MTQLDETIRAECCLSPRFITVRIVHLNPRQYHWLTRYALWLLSAIVVSGLAVRLTGSGLGCSDWPNCEPGQLVPEADFHAWVEFGNRLVTGLVSLAVVLAVLGSLRRVPPVRPHRLVMGISHWRRGANRSRGNNCSHSPITSHCDGSFLVVNGSYLELSCT